LQIEITNSFLQETIILLVYFRGYLNFGKINIRHRYANIVITKLLQEIIFKQRQQLQQSGIRFEALQKKGIVAESAYAKIVTRFLGKKCPG
jgi:hypothetical protein